MTQFALGTAGVPHLSPHLAMGLVYQHFLNFLPSWTLLSVLVGVISWLALRRFQPQLEGRSDRWHDRFSQFLHAPLNWRRDWIWLGAGCSLLLLATDYQAFTRGFFRWDDFSFIQDAREAASLPKLLNQYHADHSMPLFRLWVSGVVAWAGPSATADEMARAFNAVNFVTCLAVLLSGVALLAECGVRRVTATCFCIFAWFWPGWGEFTSGFYTLIVYPQTMICGFLAITWLLRFLRTAKSRWLVQGILCTVVAGGLDISGVWVFPAVIGFVWAGSGGRTAERRRLISLLLVAFALTAYYHVVWFKHPFVGRELVQNPGALVLNKSLLDNLVVHAWRLPLTVVSGLGGTLLSEITPGLMGLTATQFYGNFPASVPFYVAEVLAVGGAAWLIWHHRRTLSPEDRRILSALMFPVLVLIGMTSVARVHALDLPGTLWPTKYFCVPQAWAVLAGVFLLDRVALRTPAAARLAARWIAGAVIAGAWVVATFWFMERALDIPTARRPAGRQGNTTAAVLRRAELAVFQQNIEELARRVGRKQIEVPPPAGFYWAHQNLEFGYDPKLGGNFLFTDLLSVAPVTGISLREAPRAEIAADILNTIETMPTLKRVFDPTPPLP